MLGVSLVPLWSRSEVVLGSISGPLSGRCAAELRSILGRVGVDLWSMLGSMLNRSGVDSQVVLGSMCGRSVVHLGSIWGGFVVDLGPFGVDYVVELHGSGWILGSMWARFGVDVGSRFGVGLSPHLVRRRRDMALRRGPPALPRRALGVRHRALPGALQRRGAHGDALEAQVRAAGGALELRRHRGQHVPRGGVPRGGLGALPPRCGGRPVSKSISDRSYIDLRPSLHLPQLVPRAPIDPGSTPHGPHVDPESTQDGTPSQPSPTRHRPQIRHRRTPDRHHLGPGWTPNRLPTSRTSTPHRARIDLGPTLRRYPTGTALVLLWHCAGAALLLCPSTVLLVNSLLLYWYCTGAVRELCCSATAIVLRWYCTAAVPVLYEHCSCTDKALAL